MTITHIFNLLGGLALFLYGMQMMGSGLEAAAGNRMKRILEKLTSNRFLGVLVGTLITAIIQSSSATTVMVVGFVNAKMMTLQQATWIIMGASIGTTVTGVLIALDLGALAPVIAFGGVVLVVFIKNQKVNHIGQIFAGLGVLFIGMEMMGDAMVPLRESEFFLNLISSVSNPVLGIVIGAIFTAIIQSSSASVGILQALANNGLVTLSGSVYMLFGFNIGTCITAALAAIGTSRNAKRAAIIHLMFKVIGTAIFTAICLTTPLTAFLESMVVGNPAGQIALAHSLFNISTAVLLIGFGKELVKLATRILPESKHEKEAQLHLKFIPEAETEYRIGGTAIHLTQLDQELTRMLGMAKENVSAAFEAVLRRDDSHAEEVTHREEYLDYLNKEISQFISKIIASETNAKASHAISAYFKMSGDIERIGDHAQNLFDYVKMLKEKDISFSEGAMQEIEKMRDLCLSTLDSLQGKDLPEIAQLEQKNDDMTDLFRQNQLLRMQGGLCSEEGCVLYSELLTDFERIGDHALNISQSLHQVAASGAAM